MPQPKVEADCLAVKQASGIVCWQEIHDPRYKHAVVSADAATQWIDVHTDLSIPISLRAEYFRVLARGRKKVHGARPFVTPARYVAWVLAEQKGSGRKFIVVNTHFISEAFWKVPVTFRTWRTEKWNEHYQVLKELVLGFHAQGYTVLGLGDYNKDHVAKFHVDQQWLVNTDYDKVWVLEGSQGPLVAVDEQDYRLPLNSDHDGRRCTLRLTKKP